VTRPCALYRHYDADGVLLYVGVSANPKRRLWEHKCRTEWAAQVVWSETVWFDDKLSALAAEAEAVATCCPQFNKKPSRGYVDRNTPAHKHVRRLLSQWPSREAVAADACVEPIAVYRWEKRGRIPGRHFPRLLKGAQSRGIELTADELVALAEGDQ